VLKAQDQGLGWKERQANTLLIMCGICKMAEFNVSAQRSSLSDCQDRLTLCCRALFDPKHQALVRKVLLTECKTQFGKYLKTLKEQQLKDSVTVSTSNDVTPTSQRRILSVFLIKAWT
jgi:hypothetical protein